MGYLPQFLAGDATQLGKSLVTATPTQAAARDLIGLGSADSAAFGTLTTGSGGDAITPVIRIGTGSDGIYRPQGGQLRFTLGGVNSLLLQGAAISLLGVPLRIANTSNGNPVYLHNGGLNVLEQRNDTAGQIFRLHKTYTSNSNREYLQFDTTGDAYRIGSSIGSAGGTNRNLELGRWAADGSFAHTASVLTTGIEVSSRTSNLRTLLSEDGLYLSRTNNGDLTSSIRTVNTDSMAITARSHIHIRSFNGQNCVTVNPLGRVRIGPSSNENISGTDAVRIEGATRFVSDTVFLPGLPTSDPAVAGRLWNDNGTLKISAG